jgi:hypothetical protein
MDAAPQFFWKPHSFAGSGGKNFNSEVRVISQNETGYEEEDIRMKEISLWL